MCPNFTYFPQVMQNTNPAHTVKLLDAACWKENSALVQELLFQLRDVRLGKSGKVEYYHSLSWLMRNDPQTLMKNLEHLPLHGYWKDLLFLDQFALYDQSELVTKKQVRQSKRNDLFDFATVALEDVIVEPTSDVDIFQKNPGSLQNDRKLDNFLLTPMDMEVNCPTQVFVKSVSGKTITVDTSLAEDVDEIKQKIQEKEGEISLLTIFLNLFFKICFTNRNSNRTTVSFLRRKTFGERPDFTRL